MRNPATFPWLRELHRQWLAVRGKHLAARSKPFTRDWESLLDGVGIRSAEDTHTAEREVTALAKEGHFTLKFYKPGVIERVALSLASEAWLRDLFESAAPTALLEASLAHFRHAASLNHSDRVAWRNWCGTITGAFAAGKAVRPFHWRSPEAVKEILHLVHGLTSRTWPEATLIREASVALGLDSKVLENRQRIAESALASFFGQPMSLADLGIITSASRVQLAGPICLHLSDGSIRSIDQWRSTYHLEEDLARTVRITTTARRFLTIENSKTTLCRLAALNTHGHDLMAACSFPTQALKRLLELLPSDLPLFHFGDTDPAGFHILSKLRSVANRPVEPWRMHRRVRSVPVPLTAYDRALLPGLLIDPLLEDVRPILQEIQSSGDKGDYEQETLASP